MQPPKFNKGDKVLVTHAGTEIEDTVLQVFPVGVGQDNAPIIRPTDRIVYSYQLSLLRSLRYNESELKAAPPAKKSS